MLEKTHYDFTKDEVLGLAGFISKNAKALVLDNKEFPKKFHDLLQPFIEQQAKTFPDLNLSEYKDVFAALIPVRKEQQQPDLSRVSAYQVKQAQQQVQQQQQNPPKTYLKKAVQSSQKQVQKSDLPSLERFVDDIVATFSDANKKEYRSIDEEIKKEIYNNYASVMGRSEIQSNLFQILDKRLGSYKTQFQARTYKKVIAALQKCQIMDQSEINVLYVKANRFLDKNSVKKEKLKISNDIKSNHIAMGPSTQQPEKAMYIKKGELIQEQESDDDDGNYVGLDDDFEDIESDEEEIKQAPPKNKRNQKEDPRNVMYLKSFRDRVEQEQTERHYNLRETHTITPEMFKTPKGQKKLLEIEGLIRKVYKEQGVSREDLEIRDKVI